MEFGTTAEFKKFTVTEEHKLIDAIGQDLQKVMDVLQRDKLTRDERIRLEALAQSVANRHAVRAGPAQVIEEAQEFERYIRGDDLKPV